MSAETFPCCQHCPEYPDDEHNVHGIEGHTLPCTRCTPTPGIPAAERLFGADPNATLGMDSARYLRHQRGECPADEPCALCMYDVSESLVTLARNDAKAARAEVDRLREWVDNDTEIVLAELHLARTALHLVRQLCDDPDIPHAGSCASYRVFRTADGPYPCDCILASIRRALP